MNAILATVWVLWTNPAVSADTVGWCQPSTQAISDLAVVRVHQFRRWARSDSIVLVRDVHGRAGEPDSASFEIDDELHAYWVTWVDDSLNVSCESNRVFANLPSLSVPEPPRVNEDLEQFAPITDFRQTAVAGSTLSFAWTNPATLDSASECVDAGTLANDLKQVLLIALPPFPTPSRVLARMPAVGREGVPEAVTVSINVGGLTHFYVATDDTSNNRSCRSNLVDINLPPASVAPVADQHGRRWYDIQGRLLTEAPKLPGVYIRRDGVLVRRVRVLR